jgi:hypothetical protein
MKWGVKKSGDSGGKLSRSSEGASADARKADAHAKVIKAKGTAALSNQELQEYVTRLNLEQQYSRLQGPSAGAKIGNGAAKFAGDIMRTQIKKAINDVISKAVGDLLESKGLKNPKKK